MTIKRTRIQDVAEQAGVSMMTVSRVLNNDEKVSDKTRQKILSIAKELNYRPNVSARRLASSKSFFLGLVYDNPSTAYVSKFLLGALQHCRTTGYHLVVDKADQEIENTLNSVSDLIDVTKVDGMILLPPVCDNAEVIKLLTQRSVPFIRVSPDTELSSSPYICLDDYQAAFEITERLIELGHKRIAHIIGHPNQGSSRLRQQGYLDALKSHNIDNASDFIEQGFFSYKSGLAAAEKLLKLTEKPTAIFAANDDMAAAAIAAAHMNNIKVPEQLSIVGFDDTELATTVWPTITTVRQPLQEMAELAINLLISGKFNTLGNLHEEDFRHVLDFTVIERESSQAL